MFGDVSRIYSAELEGVDARPIEVEVDINIGTHAFSIVGLADRALNEAKERVNAALKNSGVKSPNRENRRVTVNLAPADVKKTGAQYDLAIAIGYLLATKQIKKFNSRDKLFLGELALDGGLRPISGSLGIAQMAKASGFKTIFLPVENANEAAVISDIEIVPIRNISHLIEVLDGRVPVVPQKFQTSAGEVVELPDLSEVRGQESAKRAMVIAAAGAHNMLMVGPPGVGKSFLAQTMRGVLPDLSIEESIELTKIWSAAGFRLGGLSKRPFRSPHPTISGVALVGGGQDPRPGEISLAHRGILFLDELPEFPRNVLESLRQPIETGVVHISRAKRSFTFPANFSLVAAMNPCPCGYYGVVGRSCKCSSYEVMKYQKKISGPLLDRIDIQIKVNDIKVGDLQGGELGVRTSLKTRETVVAARTIQATRFRGLPFIVNARMGSKDVDSFVRLDPSMKRFLGGLDLGRLSPRAYYKILKVARTIADLSGAENVSIEDIAEAYSYRLHDGVF